MTECPSARELRDWLAEIVADVTSAAIDSHVESCRNCQDRLEEATRHTQPLHTEFNRGLAGRESDAVFLAHLGTSALPLQAFRSGHQSNQRPTDSLPSFEGYIVTGVLGRGGMGVVYRATQTSLNRAVAVKTITTSPLDRPGELARFRIEAEAAARLQHPNVVQVHEVGDQDGAPFLALELIEGGCLADYLAEQSLTERQAAHLVGIMAKAVQHAHQRGIIHRDLKPANILLQWCPENRDFSGELSSGEVGLLLPRRNRAPEYCIPKITDFGLAKLIRSPQGDTLSGAILGTPSYMAPEQARGRTGDLSTAVDVYALGAILYELLTGRPPFRGETAGETLYQVLNDSPIPPSRDRLSLAKDLEAICLKCLEKDPRNRYPTAQDLAEDLRRFEADEPVRARTISAWVRFRKFARRKPAATALGLVIACAALATFGAAFWYQARLESWLQKVSDERDIAQGARIDAEGKRIEAETQRDRARENLYLAQIPQAQRAWDSAHLERLSGILNGQIPTEPGQNDLRNLEWNYLHGLAHCELKTLVGHEGLVTAVAFHPNGKRIASASADGTIRIWDVGTGREIIPPLKRHMDRVTSIAFDSRGHRLVSTGADKLVHLWDAETGEYIRSFAGHTDWVYHAAFSEDGKRLATGSEDRTIRLWSVDTGQETGRLLGHAKQVTFVAFSPDQQTLASASADKTIRIWGLKESVTLQVLEGHTGWVYAALFSPDGKSVASSSFDKTIRIWDPANGRELHKYVGHKGQIRGLAFNRDGTRLASASYDQTVRIWDAKTGDQLNCLKGHRGKIHAVVFHPDGETIASGGEDHAVKFWDASSLQDYESVRHRGGIAINALAVRSDNRLIAAGATDGTVQLWDPVAKRASNPIAGSGHEVYSLAFSPDQRILAIGYADKSLILWDLKASKPIHTIVGHFGRVSGLAFSPDSNKVASVSYDGHLRLWEVGTGDKLHDATAHAGRVTSVAFNGDGTRLATAGEDRFVRIWNVETGKESRTLEEHFGWVHCLAFSSDGERLASGSEDGSIRLWETKNWNMVRSLEGHSGRVSGLAFSPDGQRLLSAGHEDKIVKIWELKQGHELLSLQHPGSVRAVAIRPDGRGFASAGEFAEVRLWNTAPLSR